MIVYDRRFIENKKKMKLQKINLIEPFSFIFGVYGLMGMIVLKSLIA